MPKPPNVKEKKGASEKLVAFSMLVVDDDAVLSLRKRRLFLICLFRDNPRPAEKENKGVLFAVKEEKHAVSLVK